MAQIIIQTFGTLSEQAKQQIINKVKTSKPNHIVQVQGTMQRRKQGIN